MSPKTPDEGRVAVRVAYIGLAGVVLAAVIGGAVTIYSDRSSNAAAPAPQRSPYATPTASSASSGSSSPSASSSPSPSSTSSAGKTWTEFTFSQAKTFADYLNAGIPLGAPLSPQQAVKVSCRVQGFAVADGDRWWYRLAQSPWNGRYYATTDVFYNIPTPTGDPINGVVFDKRVPVCLQPHTVLTTAYKGSGKQ